MGNFATVLMKRRAHWGGYLALMAKNGLGPEVGMEHGGYEAPTAHHRELAAFFRDRGLPCAVHLPFLDVAPGAASAITRDEALDRFLFSAQITSCYAPAHFIGHPEFRRETDGRPGAPDEPTGRWLDDSARVWSRFLAETDAPLYLENTYDRAPTAILALLERLPAGRCGFCLDLGHWHYTAGGRGRADLQAWLGPIAASGRLRHLHLHDNDGTRDCHWGLGKGTIDWPMAFGLLAELGLKPGYTLEAHYLDALEDSLAWLRDNSSVHGF